VLLRGMVSHARPVIAAAAATSVSIATPDLTAETLSTDLAALTKAPHLA